ncbi:MAG: UDP-3-O-(3-hydroxymyristoyl)glucosamine N-acyltransferase, partial [Flavobacteriaceae bacterium]|nr:UDP-3-O-(3-hydroxymyristoyl)glucosamine N-acyltransferase [Flavobacteriaceae bacterium]
AQIHPSSIIQPNCFIGNNVIIGKDCIIHSNVSIYDNTLIGNNVTIHSGSVLGASAFYYKRRPEGYDQLLSGGRVVIKDNVDIGALCTIDRGVTADTIIGEGSKLDNQIQVGHDTIIGKNCLIASQTGIAGCVVIEDNVTIWGQVGIASGITIKEKTVIAAQSGVNKTLEGNRSYFGSPVAESRVKMREMNMLKQIPELIEDIKAIKRNMQDSEK